MTALIQDKDRRRAFLLSLLLHTFALFLLLWFYTRPDPVPLESFLVIEVGNPALSETQTNAATADAPAPQASEPLVEAETAGEPVAQQAPPVEVPAPSPEVVAEPEPTVEPEPVAEPTPVPEVPEPVASEPPPAPSEAIAETPAVEPSPVESPPEPTAVEPPPVEEATEAPAPVPEVVTETPVVPAPQVLPPAPTVQQPQATPELLPDVDVTTTLPEIQEVEIAPQPVAQALAIPQPALNATVSQARSVTTTPTIDVNLDQVVPQPDVSTDLATEQEVPAPEASTEVDIAASIPQPQASSTVATEQSVPTPQVETTINEAATVPQPNVQAEASTEQAIPQPNAASTVNTASSVPQPAVQSAVSETQAVPQPSVEASVSTTTAVPQPNVQSNVATTTSVPQPTVQSNVASSAAVPQPNVESSVSQGSSVAVTATSQVTGAQTVPTPAISATVTAVVPEATPSPVATTSSESEAESSVSTPGQDTNSTPGGNADRPGQSTAQDNASEENLGLAAGPDGSEEPTGAPLARVPYRENRQRPLTVMLDNLRGYPQTGLLEASLIVEMPVEGGITRLMTVYDNLDPARVGPVRSAREYFHELSSSMNGILVHDGGSPGALAAIERSNIPSINAYYSTTEVFQRNANQSAPYNLYSGGNILRQEMSKLNLNSTRTVSGNFYVPEVETQDSSGVSVAFSGAYQSGFRYLDDINLYRWVRNGSDASDGLGEAVLVDAVLIADIAAVPVPGDTEGRLYIPMRGGTATLYLRGKQIAGRWDLINGIQFTTSLGEIVDLAPYKTWVSYAPQTATITSQ